MRRIVYYVASSADGFICGPGGDISGFVQSSDGIKKYMADLKTFDTVIMGRGTYEFGYRFGLQPGQPAYAHMKHYIFSDSLRFENAHENVMVKPVKINEVQKLKEEGGSDIYLCGGGVFAGWLLDHGVIDILKLKLNPFIQGSGTRLFGDSTSKAKLELIDSEAFDGGLQIVTFKVI